MVATRRWRVILKSPRRIAKPRLASTRRPARSNGSIAVYMVSARGSQANRDIFILSHNSVGQELM